MNGLGTIAAQMWSQAGVQVTPKWTPPARTGGSRRIRGAAAWSVETWGGHPDLSFFLDSYHSDYIVEPGEIQPARNWMRWQNPELDRIIEEIRGGRLQRPREASSSAKSSFGSTCRTCRTSR